MLARVLLLHQRSGHEASTSTGMGGRGGGPSGCHLAHLIRAQRCTRPGGTRGAPCDVFLTLDTLASRTQPSCERRQEDSG